MPEHVPASQFLFIPSDLGFLEYLDIAAFLFSKLDTEGVEGIESMFAARTGDVMDFSNLFSHRTLPMKGSTHLVDALYKMKQTRSGRCATLHDAA